MVSYSAHPALTLKIVIFDNRGAVQYVQRLYMTCSFRVMSVGMRETLYWKVVVMHFQIHNLPIVILHSALTQRIDISNSIAPI